MNANSGPAERELLAEVAMLIVDDNEHMLRLLVKIIQAMGCKRIHQARNGKEAIDVLRGISVDIMMTDCWMSPVDGIALTKYVRTKSENVYLPIVMVTGLADPEMVAAARDAGVTELLAKPISARGLLLRICHLVSNPRPFVRNDTFFGPDRRRRMGKRYSGAERRTGPDPAQFDLPQEGMGKIDQAAAARRTPSPFFEAISQRLARPN